MHAFSRSLEWRACVNGPGGHTSSRASSAACRAPLEKELEACKSSAANLLAFRPHSRAELAGKLTDKGYDHATIDAALLRIQDLVRLFWLLPVPSACLSPAMGGASCMQVAPGASEAAGPWRQALLLTSCADVRLSQGLQSDRDFAATFARSKWRQSRWAPSRIRIVRHTFFGP